MKFKPEYYKRNRQKLMDRLGNNSVAIIYSGNEIKKSLDENYTFYPNNNFVYLTGLEEPEGLLILNKKDDSSLEEYLFIPKANHLKEKWVGYKYSKEQAEEISGIKDIFNLEEIEEILNKIKKEEPTYYQDNSLAKFNNIKLPIEEDINELKDHLFKLRLIKEPEEIEATKEAIDITAMALNVVLQTIKPELEEYKLAALFEYLIKIHGADSVSFETIVASGKNGPILHYVKNDNLLKDGELVLFDLGARKDGYSADVSRTYPISGEFNEIQKKFYNALLETQYEMIDLYTAGTKLKDIQEATKKSLEKSLLAQGIELPDGGIDQWYYHSIGHSLGLDTHDGENRDLVLEDNMIITCEPGVYAQEYNIGIRIEDDILINGNNPIVLTKDIPKTIDEIENLMK